MDDHLRRAIRPAVVRVGAMQRAIQSDVQQSQLVASLHNWSCAHEFYLGVAPPRLAAALSPASTAPSLLPHQREGVRWLLALHRHGIGGGIVADEMGLGKTAQVIAYFSALARAGAPGTHLVVAPLSTLANWERELRYWSPWLHLCVFRGNHRQRAALRRAIRRRHCCAFEHGDALRGKWASGATPAEIALDVGGVVLTSYEGVLADGGALVRCVCWDTTVVDEAHRLKRFNCRLIEMLRKGKCGMRLVLTGTPVQNTVREMWTLLEYVAPTIVDGGDQAQANLRAAVECVSRRTTTRLKRPRLEPSSSVCSGGSDCSAESQLSCEESTLKSERVLLDLLQELLRPFVLRRTKASTRLFLPPKCDILVPVPLTTKQWELYHRVAAGTRYGNGRLMHLRKCCLHPFLFDEFYGEVTAGPVDGDGRNDGDARLLQLMLEHSGKLALLDKMLDTLCGSAEKNDDGPHRVLLFSQMTRVLDVIEEYLQLRNRVRGGHAVTHVRLDGLSSMEERHEAIRLFSGPAAAASDAVLVHHRRVGNVESGIAADDCIFDSPVPKKRVGEVSGDEGGPLRSRSVNVHAAVSTIAKAHCKSKRKPADAETGTKVTSHSTATPPVSPAASLPSPLLGQDEAQLFLISTRTGGAGLNLNSADTVILFDGDFNPHNDRQAVDRCHRIGQRRLVAVYRLLCPGTVEEEQLQAVRHKLHLEGCLLGTASEAALTSTDGAGCVGASVCTTFMPVRNDCDADSDVIHFTPLDADEHPGSCLMQQFSENQLHRVLDRHWLCRVLSQT